MNRNAEKRRLYRDLRAQAVLLAFVLMLLQGCSGGPKAGTVYGPDDAEENLYLDLTAEEARAQALGEKILPEAPITDSGYTITQVDESDVYPPKKTDENGNALPAYLVDYALRISNAGNERAMIRPTVTAVAEDSSGNVISTSKKTIRTYILPGEEIAYAADMTVRGEQPARVWFSAAAEDPDTYYPSQEELDMPGTDSYQTGEVSVRVSSAFEEKAPSAGRKSSEGLSRGYFRIRELPELSGTIACSSERDQEAFVTVLFLDDGRILGGETGRVFIPAGKTAEYVLTAAAAVPAGTDSYEVSAFSIAEY